MRNKKLALMLAASILQPGLNGITMSEKVKLDEFLETRKKEIDEKIDRLQKLQRGLGVLVLLLQVVSGLAYSRYKSDNFEYMRSDKSIKKIMARFDKLEKIKGYNAIYKEFMKEISKISIECNKNDYGKKTNTERDIVAVKDKAYKSGFEAQKTPFKLIAKKSCPICDDYTTVFGTIAQSFGLYCAKLSLYPTQKGYDPNIGHSVLLIAKQKAPVTDPMKPWIWRIFDGRNFTDKTYQRLKDDDGTICIDDLDEHMGPKYKDAQLFASHNMLAQYATTGMFPGAQLRLNAADVQNLKDGGYLNVFKFV